MVEITGAGLSLEEVVDVARRAAPVRISGDAVRRRMEASLEWVRRAVEGESPVYGINTGFGVLARQRVASADASRLSRNVILKCCSGVGPPLSEEVVRAMMLIRADTLARGMSGVRPLLVETYAAMLNAGVTPHVPAKGSLGASGDLAPLAHIAVVMTRDPDSEGRTAEDDEARSGFARFEGELLSGAAAMRQAGLERFVPGPKEGLALTNGTTLMLAVAVLAVLDAENLLDTADAAAALSLEALTALSAAFDPEVHEVSGQPGQAEAAARIRRLLEGSRLIDADPTRVQDAYSLRCIPQVHGPARDAVAFVRSRVESLLRGTSDNPLVFPPGGAGADGRDGGPDGAPGGEWRAISAGNFHGQGLAFWLDLVGIVTAEVASLAERRTFRLLTPELSNGLPAMLVPDPGLDSGLMMGQYTQAALVSDNKTLAHPDSVDSIPSSANQEDHVSMGANAARHCCEILDNVRHVLAIELMTAAQGVDLRESGPERLGRGTARAHAQVRALVPRYVHDRALTPDIERLATLIHGGALSEGALELTIPHEDE